MRYKKIAQAHDRITYRAYRTEDYLEDILSKLEKIEKTLEELTKIVFERQQKQYK